MLFIHPTKNLIIMRKTVFTILGTLAIAGLFAFTYAEVKETAAEKEVKDLILKCYVHGAFNELNPDAMRKGFHPDFAIFSADFRISALNSL